MPTKYTRKKTTKAVVIEKGLAKCLENTNDGGLPNRKRFIPASAPFLANSFTNLGMWLDEFVASAEPLLFSALLQLWLRANGCTWPRGVFKADLSCIGSGRRPSDLRFKAWLLYKPGVVGYRKVAMKLTPEDYKCDPERAAKRIKQLLASERADLSPLEALKATAYQLLGIPEHSDG